MVWVIVFVVEILCTIQTHVCGYVTHSVMCNAVYVVVMRNFALLFCDCNINMWPVIAHTHIHTHTAAG